MAKKPQPEELQKIKSENKALKAENLRLKQLAAKNPATTSRWNMRFWKSVGAIFFISLSVALLIVGNVLFWTGNTIVKNDRYTATVAPLIRNPQIQTAIASYTTQQIFNNINVSQYISNVLPPRADFLAPTIASQLQSGTNIALQRVLANPSFQDKWNNAQSKAHAQFINLVGKHGSDGVINLNEIYQELSANLANTKLSFLAGKQLPSKVGDIQIVKGPEISVLNKVINHIDLWRILAVILFIGSAVAGIWLSRRRRRAIIRLGLLLSGGMLLTLVSLRLTREIIAGKVNPAYADAVRQAVEIIFHPLVVQTVTLMAAALAVTLIAWLSGTSKSATAVKARTSDLLAGKLHSAIFRQENGFSLWLGSHKRYVQWSIVAIFALIDLIFRLTPALLITSLILLLILVLAVEVLAALPKPQRS